MKMIMKERNKKISGFKCRKKMMRKMKNGKMIASSQFPSWSSVRRK